MSLVSHAGVMLSRLAGDAAAEATLNMAQCRCRAMLMMQLLSQCCLWHDIDAE
jgi:hypothetical protein